MSHIDTEMSTQLGDLQGKGDHFTKLMVVEKKREADLLDAIQHITKEVEKYRVLSKNAAVSVMNKHSMAPNPSFSRADGNDVARQANAVTFKLLNYLEGKLNKRLSRKSEILVSNKKLKLDIDHYRRLRLQTDSAHKQFEAILADTKATIEARLRESTDVVEERENYLEKKDALEQINLEEQRIFEAEHEEKGAYVKKQNVALEESLLRERKEEAAASTAAKRKAADDMTSSFSGGGSRGGTRPSIAAGSIVDGTGSLSTLDANGNLWGNEDMVKQMNDLNVLLEQEQKTQISVQEKIRDYETMFEQLKKMTGTDRLEELVTAYVAHEDEMFSLYNFIQTINAEIDTVVEANALIQQEIDDYRTGQQEQDHVRESHLNDMFERLQLTLQQAQESEDQSKRHKDSVAQISKKVSSLFYKLQCDQMDNKAPSTTPSGSKAVKGTTMTKMDSNIAYLTSQGISEANVLQFMGCVEQRAVEIISEYLRTTALNTFITNKAPNSKKSLVVRHLSPTPGPKIPMTWSMEPVLDIDLVREDELLDAIPDDQDNRPIDLKLFKGNMQRLNLTLSPNGTFVLPTMSPLNSPKRTGSGGEYSPQSDGSPKSREGRKSLQQTR